MGGGVGEWERSRLSAERKENVASTAQRFTEHARGVHLVSDHATEAQLHCF
jgi:hypothetical protein